MSSEHNFMLIEKSILGTMMKENYLIQESQLKIDHFTVHYHKNIFMSMQELQANNIPADALTIIASQNPELFGGASYVMEISGFYAAEKFDAYTKLLYEHWREGQKRQILQQAQEEDWGLNVVQKALDSLDVHASKVDTSIKALLAEQLERPFKPLVASQGILTGLKDLDKMLGGFRKKELTILAARPSIGKTDTMNHFALAEGRNGYLPIIFSLEMSEELLVDRLIANVGSFNRLKMRDPYQYLSEEQKARWMSVIGELDNCRIQIDDRSGLTVSQIRATARKVINENPGYEPIILIDYLQKIAPDTANKNATRAQEVGAISGGLKDMAKDFNCPVICLSQLSRGVETRNDKRPINSDLRDSGEIEQDADVIAFLYRDDYYEKESESKGLLEIIISKQRNGPTGTATVVYKRETGRLLNVDWSQK